MKFHRCLSFFALFLSISFSLSFSRSPLSFHNTLLSLYLTHVSPLSLSTADSLGAYKDFLCFHLSRSYTHSHTHTHIHTHSRTLAYVWTERERERERE